MSNKIQLSFLFPLALFLAFGLTSCGDDTTEPDDLSGTFFSAEKTVGDGTAKLFVTRDVDGNPTAVGFRISEDALNSLPTADNTTSFEMISEGSATVFKYVTLDWNPHGHQPTMIFDTAHFDMHFYTMTKAELDANINPADADFQTKAENFPDSNHIPAGYAQPPGAPVEAVPSMGVHWLDLADVPAPGTFTEVMIFGSWNGQIHFVEPMMTRDWLLTKPTLNENLAQPQAWPKSGYWPTTYTVSFDAATSEYVITLGGMMMRTAS